MPPKVVQPSLETDASAPALSPDGSRVAFEVPGKGLLVCMLHSGGQCQSIDVGLGWAARPTWEPRSGELLFVRYTADADGEDSDLFITRNSLETVGPLVLQTGNQDDPELSPDGRWLIYSSAQTLSLYRSGVQVIRQLWIMDLATGSAQPLVPDAHQDQHPAWSPNGGFIAFASNRGGNSDIWVVRVDGTGLRRVTSGPGVKTWPAWAPSGKALLYSLAHEGSQELWMIDLESSETERYRPFGEESRILRDADWR